MPNEDLDIGRREEFSFYAACHASSLFDIGSGSIPHYEVGRTRMEEEICTGCDFCTMEDEPETTCPDCRAETGDGGTCAYCAAALPENSDRE